MGHSVEYDRIVTDDDDDIPFDKFTDLQVILCIFIFEDLIFLGGKYF